MGSSYEVEVTISSAKELKNINWRNGPLKPYVVVWIDPKSKSSTHIDEDGDMSPRWNETLKLPFHSTIEDSTLHMDIVHHSDESDDIKNPLIGSARIALRDVVDDVGLGNDDSDRKLKLKRPSGRPQGKLEINVNVRELCYPPPGARPAPYGVPPPQTTRDYYPAPPQQYGYGAPYAPPPYDQPRYGQPGYDQPSYYGQPNYGQEVYSQAPEEKKSSKFGGMGTGLAVGAAAGLLGGLAIAEGFDYMEDKIADDVAEKVEDDLGYDDE